MHEKPLLARCAERRGARPLNFYSNEGFTSRTRDHKVIVTALRVKGEGMAAAQFEALEVSEVDAIRGWRFDELVRAGYDDEDAIELAFHLDVDLHLATNLVRRGCPSSTAVRIAL
jgi:hypothetical protein